MTTKKTTQLLEQAIDHQQAVRIHYSDVNGELTERVITPLFFNESIPTLMGAWCHLRASDRNFRTERIERVEQLSQQEALDASFELIDSANSSPFISEQQAVPCELTYRLLTAGGFNSPYQQATEWAFQAGFAVASETPGSCSSENDIEALCEAFALGVKASEAAFHLAAS
jgi:hypothetical protein